MITNGNFSEKSQKLGLNLHGDPCLASGGLDSQAALAANFAFNNRQIGSGVRSGCDLPVGLLFDKRSTGCKATTGNMG